MALSSFTLGNIKEKFSINWNKKNTETKGLWVRDQETQSCFFALSLKYVLYIYMRFFLNSGEKIKHSDINI